MTEKSDKGSRSLDGEKDRLDEEIIPEKAAQDRRDLAQFKFDDTSEHDYYDRAISDANHETLTSGTMDLQNEFDEPVLAVSDNLDSSTDALTSDSNTEFLDIGTPALVATTSKPSKPLDDSDEIVRRLRHGEADFYQQTEQKSTANPTKTSHYQSELASPFKRLFARIFDLVWLVLLLLVSLALFLKFVNSPAVGLVTQSLSVQLGLAFLLLPLALILEAAILSDFGNTPGKSLFGLKITRDGPDKIKFRQYFGRGFLLWIKGLAFGIPILSFFTLLWQRFHLSKYDTTSYDKSMSMQVSGVETSVAKKAYLLISSIVLVSLIGYLAPIKAIPSTASGALNTLELKLKRITGDLNDDKNTSSLEVPIERNNSNNEKTAVSQSPDSSEVATEDLSSTATALPTNTEPVDTISTQKNTIPWTNPITLLSTDVDDQWVVTIDPESKQSFNWMVDGESQINITVWNDNAIASDFNTVINNYIVDASNKFDFEDESSTYLLDDKVVWESRGKLLADDSTQVKVKIGNANNQVWVFETILPGPTNQLEFIAERLKAALWSTL